MAHNEKPHNQIAAPENIQSQYLLYMAHLLHTANVIDLKKYSEYQERIKVLNRNELQDCYRELIEVFGKKCEPLVGKQYRDMLDDLYSGERQLQELITLYTELEKKRKKIQTIRDFAKASVVSLAAITVLPYMGYKGIQLLLAEGEMPYIQPKAISQIHKTHIPLFKEQPEAISFSASPKKVFLKTNFGLLPIDSGIIPNNKPFKISDEQFAFKITQGKEVLHCVEIITSDGLRVVVSVESAQAIKKMPQETGIPKPVEGDQEQTF